MLVFFQEMVNIFIRKRHRLYKKTRPARKALAVEADEWSTSPACSVALREPATSCDVDPAVGLLRRTHQEHLDYYYSRHVHPHS